jgi:hypothetical protein
MLARNEPNGTQKWLVSSVIRFSNSAQVNTSERLELILEHDARTDGHDGNRQALKKEA